MGAPVADFVSEQIDRWERFGALLERTIDRASVLLANTPNACFDCGDAREIPIDEATIEAMQRARDLCLMEAEEWRARQRQQPRDTRNAVATGTDRGGA